MDREKTQYVDGQDGSPPEETKPIIDQVAELAAAAAGTLAATAVKAGAKKRKAVAKRLPRPVKKAANTIAKATKALKKKPTKSPRSRRIRRNEPNHRPDVNRQERRWPRELRRKKEGEARLRMGFILPATSSR